MTRTDVPQPSAAAVEEVVSMSSPSRSGGRPAGPDRARTHAEEPTLRLTVYGCEPDEAAAFRALAPSFGVSLAVTGEPVSEINADLARECACVSVGHKARVPRGTLERLAAAGVRYVSTRSIGHDHVDVAAAASVGIEVGTVAYSPDSVADHTVMLMLMALRDAKAIIRRTDAHDYRLSATRGRELRDLTVGVIGTGRIGTAVVDRLRGFGCSVLTHDIRPSGAGRHVPLDELLQRSDVVTLHTPLTAATTHLLDRSRIDRMRPGAVLVNTARGALVDTAALVAALETGHLRAAALDVVEGEDGVFYADRRSRHLGDDRLLRLQRLPNVVITPHTAYFTDHALRDTVENTLRNCLAFSRRDAAWTR